MQVSHTGPTGEENRAAQPAQLGADHIVKQYIKGGSACFCSVISFTCARSQASSLLAPRIFKKITFKQYSVLIHLMHATPKIRIFKRHFHASSLGMCIFV